MKHYLNTAFTLLVSLVASYSQPIFNGEAEKVIVFKVDYRFKVSKLYDSLILNNVNVDVNIKKDNITLYVTDKSGCVYVEKYYGLIAPLHKPKAVQYLIGERTHPERTYVLSVRKIKDVLYVTFSPTPINLGAKFSGALCVQIITTHPYQH